MQDTPNQANHGTQVLSILAGFAPGQIVGPAYRADFILGKTEWIATETEVEEDAWIEAIEWAEGMGADIVTSSLSYSRWYRPQDEDGATAVISRAANLALERGLLVFNSIGNHGPGDRTLSPPSDSPGTIAVGAIDWNGRLTRFSSTRPDLGRAREARSRRDGLRRHPRRPPGRGTATAAELGPRTRPRSSRAARRSC